MQQPIDQQVGGEYNIGFINNTTQQPRNPLYQQQVYQQSQNNNSLSPPLTLDGSNNINNLLIPSNQPIQHQSFTTPHLYNQYMQYSFLHQQQQQQQLQQIFL